MFKKLWLLSILCIIMLASSVVFGASLGDGITLYNAGKYTEAINVFKTVVGANSKDAVALHYYGLSYIKLKNDSEAIKFLNKSIAANPAYTKPYMDAILCYERLHDFKNALVLIDELISVDSSYKDVHYEQGRIYSALGKNTEAVASFKNQRAIDASNVWGTLYIASDLMSQGNYAPALNELMLIEKFDSNKFNTAMIRTLIQEKSGDIASSLETMLSARELYKDNQGYMLTQDFNLAWYDYKSGNYSKAIQASSKDLIFKSAKPSNGYFNLARIYADRGQYAEAVVALKRATYFDPDVTILTRIDPIFQTFIKSNEYKALDDVIMLVDGATFNIKNATDFIPIIVKNDVLMVPVYSSSASPVNIFERIGAQFTYDSNTWVINAVKGDSTLKFDLKNKVATFRNKNLNLSQNAMIQGTLIYVPIETVLKQFGLTYSYNNTTKLLDISYFKDVPKNSWYSYELGFAADKGIVKGFADNTFRPSVNVSVDQFIVMTLNSMGHTNIETASSNWAKNYIDKAIELGYIGSNEFSNYKNAITREQAAGIISRALRLQTTYNFVEIEKSFVDFGTISQLYKTEVLKAYASGIMTLNAGEFNPKDNVNRSSAVVLITKLVDASRRTPPIINN